MTKPMYFCPGCDRPLRRLSSVPHESLQPQYSMPHALGNWVCVGCPRYSGGLADRYFWEHQMPHPPGTPHEVIVRDIRNNLKAALESNRRCSSFPSWSECAVAYLLGVLDGIADERRKALKDQS